MPTIGPLIADSAQLGLGYAERLLKELPADNFARLARAGDHVVEANHPAFLLGHLSLYPCRVVAQLGHDAAAIEPTASETDVFSKDAKCVDDPQGTIYPSMNKVTERFFTAYRTAIEVVTQADDKVFERENPNEAMRKRFATLGSMHAFYLGGHLMMHLGQFSTWRRVWGFPPA